MSQKCKAKAKRTGKQCQRDAVIGLEVCQVHGGSTARAKEKSARIKQEMKVQRHLDRLGLRREGLAPTELLQETIERVGADLEYAASQAQGSTEWADAYQQILDRAARIAKAGVDAGIAERQTQLQEAQVLMLIRAIDTALSRAGLDPYQMSAVKGELVRELRQLEAA